MTTITRYQRGGNIRKIAESGDSIRYGVPVLRASHVEPVNRVWRGCFYGLRWLFGDCGVIADWTRGWQCSWQARMLLGSRPVLGPFKTHCDATRAETAWILKNWVLANTIEGHK